MSIRNDNQLKNTLRKLSALEDLYAQTKARPVENVRVQELTLRSFRRTINELKEEIARYRAGARGADKTAPRIRTAREVENLRKKLEALEEEYAASLQRGADNGLVRELGLRSLKRTINQLKEEIARYQARLSTMSKK